MPPERLKVQVEAELAQMTRVVRELAALRVDIGEESPSLRDIVAAGAFLAQFYNGVENILKRIAVASDVSLPEGERWPVALLDMFSSVGKEKHFALDEALVTEFRSYMGFRHVVRSGYGMDLDWDRLVIGIERLPKVFERFEEAVRHYTLA
jgi:hypothetical protein